MKPSTNSLTIDFTTYTDSSATDTMISIRAANIDDEKLVEVLNSFLASIGSSIVVRNGRNG